LLETELVRMEQCHRLRARLAALCSMCLAARPLLIFERWQSRLKLFEETNESVDVLLPFRLDRVFYKDLARLDLSEQDTQWIGAEFEKDLRQALRAIRECDEWADGHPEPPVVINDRDGKVVYCAVRGKTLKLNKTHYDKLFAAYSADGNQTSFGEHLFAMLCRYSALHGHGYQAAVDERTFASLERHLGVSMELFASPLNNYFPQFCSAFEDTDSFFGSKGCFFQFFPSTGSFQANPPFVPETMDAMVKHIHNLLDNKTNGALSFTIFVPHWDEIKAVKALKKSSYLANSINVVANEHGYIDGAAHQSSSRYRFSSFDTYVAVLQNEAGKQKWPASDRVMQRIRKRMAQVEISDAQTCRFAVEPQYKKQAENSGESKKRNQHVEDIPPAKRKKKQKENL